MNVFKKFIEVNNYAITGGSEYQWNCFGPNVRYLDCDVEDTCSINCLFNSVDQTVYVIEAWDYVNHRDYRWINPDYHDELKKEYNQREINFENSSDSDKFIELEVLDDMFEKISAIRAGVAYDTRVKVPLNIPDDELFKIMIAAHERDMTLNAFVEEALVHAIEKAQEDPQKFKSNAKHWDTTPIF